MAVEYLLRSQQMHCNVQQKRRSLMWGGGGGGPPPQCSLHGPAVVIVMPLHCAVSTILAVAHRSCSIGVAIAHKLAVDTLARGTA